MGERGARTTVAGPREAFHVRIHHRGRRTWRERAAAQGREGERAATQGREELIERWLFSRKP